MKKLLLLMRGIVAFILLQSLFYKFTAHPQATYIFTTLGIEPYGRIGIGIAELIVSVLLFFSKTKIISILSIIGIMIGAIFSHLFTDLGIAVKWTEVYSDGGLLFGMAVICLLFSIIILFLHYERNYPINSFKKAIGL